MHATLLIKAMSDHEDSERIGEALLGVENVRGIDVDLNQQTVVVELDDQSPPSKQQLVDVVEKQADCTVDRIETTRAL